MTDEVVGGARARPERWLVAVTEYAGLTAYTGGIGRHYASLLPALARLGITVDLIVFSDGPPLPDHDLDGVTLLGYHDTSSAPRGRLLLSRARIVKAAYSGGSHYDRVFMPEWAALGALLPANAPLLTNLATSMALANKVAGLTLSDFPPSSRGVVALQSYLEGRQIRRSAGLISISHAMLAQTRASFPTLPPVRVVRNCIDVRTVATAAHESELPEGWPAGTSPTVLFLGRLERRKGVVEAVSAFARVLERFPDARLVMAGSTGDRRFEPDKNALLSLLPPASREQVVWLGHVPGDSLYGAIRRSTVTICPSLWEGFGNAALEAKAIGAPLVCTTGSGFDDFCEHGVDCLMVPPADAGRLAHAIARVLADPRLGNALGQAAAITAQRYAPDPVAADLAIAADELLGVVRPS